MRGHAARPIYGRVGSAFCSRWERYQCLSHLAKTIASAPPLRAHTSAPPPHTSPAAPHALRSPSPPSLLVTQPGACVERARVHSPQLRRSRSARAAPAPPPRHSCAATVTFRAACAQTREPGLGLRGSVWVASCREARTWQSQRQRQSTERCRQDGRERARLERSAGRRRVTSHYGVLRRRGLTSHRTCVLKKCQW